MKKILAFILVLIIAAQTLVMPVSAATKNTEMEKKLLTQLEIIPKGTKDASGLSRMEFALAKAEVFEPAKLPALEEQKTALLSERKTILSGLGIEETQLVPQFSCERCQDTGYLKSGVACNCYKAEK